MMPIIESHAQRDALIERNKKIIAMGESGHVTVDEIDLLNARIALASLETESVGKFALEAIEKRYHHIKHGEQQHTMPKLPLVKLYPAAPVPVLKPVDLSGCYSYSSAYTRTAYISKAEVIQAIRAAGVPIAGEDNATTE